MIRTPNTFIMGAGPVATTLAGALRLRGVPVLGLWARRPAAARAAGAIAGVASYSAAPPDLLLQADVVLLAVRDEAIAAVAGMLLRAGLVTTHHVMLHCSGALSAAEVFADARAHVGGIGTLHPLRAIADGRAAMRAMAGTVFGIEGDERGRAAGRCLARAIGGQPLALSGEQMALYHAAAAVASNYVVALIDAAVALLARAGVERDDAVTALLPLARGSLANIEQRGLARGLTGPIRRGDHGTVARHLEALADAPEVAALYRVLGRRTVDVARRIGDVADAELDAIAALLGGPTSSSQGAPDASQGTDPASVESRAYRA